MFEKKNYIVNCDVCDTRKITQESLSGYEQIVINADLLLVDENSRAILNRLPLICNADETLDVEGEVSVICANGSYEISGDTRIEDQTVICVNGDLSVRSGTQKVLEKILKISVNGSAKYPESMAPFLNRLAVNGSVQCIPDGCIELKPVFTIDRFFPLRARQNGSYYVDEKVVLMDPEADVESLVAKNVRFVTKRFLVRQELISRSIALFEESVEMDVIPTGFAFVDGDTELTDALLQKHGTRLYIDGDLNLKDGSENCLERLDALCVKGNVRLLKRQEEAFSRVDATYEALVFVKGRYIMEGLVILHETLNSIHVKKQSVMLFKVDFEKVYDKVKWPFLQQCMRMKGFPRKWCQWIDTFV